jgi:hypothetical protein
MSRDRGAMGRSQVPTTTSASQRSDPVSCCFSVLTVAGPVFRRLRIVPIIERHWEPFFETKRSWIRPVVLETVRKLLACRTPALGCHVYQFSSAWSASTSAARRGTDSNQKRDHTVSLLRCAPFHADRSAGPF